MKILDLYITKVCNLNCEYCYVDIVQNENPFDEQEFSQRINILEYDHIKFFGGEPLLKWELIKKIIDSTSLKKKNMKFTIVTNGLLLNENILSYCLDKSVSVVVSMHYKGIVQTLKKIKDYTFFNTILGFNFIYEPNRMTFPTGIIMYLGSIGFTSFIITPEVYSDWSDKNIKILGNQLKILLKLYTINRNINFNGIDGNYLKELTKGCEKTIVGKKGEKYGCNRFDKLEKLKKYNYHYIHSKFEEIIDLQNDKNKWFYICPIGWFLDSFDTPSAIDNRILEFKNLNRLFIDFYKKIASINGETNFLSDNIDEIRFNVTSQCNIRCTYCYVDFKNQTLSEKNAKNIIDFFMLQDGEEKTISFFGGEPFLEFPLLQKLVKYAHSIAKMRSKKVSFSVATNFLLIDEQKVQFLKDNNFNIHVSFNGKVETNDSMRDNSTGLLLNNLSKYGDIIGKGNITMLLAFSSVEVKDLYNNVESIYKQGFSTINLEIIFGKKYRWSNADILIMRNQLLMIRKSYLFERVNFMNSTSKKKYLDISVDGKAGSNSLDFHNYKANFNIKKIFDRLIKKIF